ncbi:MAG: SDR family NAD(P)-dependent oxidoreductase [Chitinophagales bacterium]|nr:SDR family NAD(P)-dependent oxidoreductase [Chitinophagales bacterium]
MYQLSKRFPAKRAFITGAASGFGKALCFELAKDGWTLGMADINVPLLETTASEMEQAGAKVYLHPLDVADKDAYQKVAETFLQQVGGIDLLFNNAGVAIGGDFEARPLDDWEWINSINFMGVVHGCHLFIPAMKKQGYGHIINTSSAASFGCLPQMAAYNATKAAVLAISETLYSELHPYNIQVSAIMPTFFKTNIANNSRGDEITFETGQLMVDTSGIEAAWVAQRVLKAAGNKRLHIVLPRDAKALYWLKRHFPLLYIRIIRSLAGDRQRMLQYLRKKQQSMAR